MFIKTTRINEFEVTLPTWFWLVCRAMQLASIFMSGVEAAIIANDACGSPVPWEFCCPWLFFDGKLFHSKWLQSSMNVATLELCEGKVWSLHTLCLILGAFFDARLCLSHFWSFETTLSGLSIMKEFFWRPEENLGFTMKQGCPPKKQEGACAVEHLYRPRL